MDKDLILQVKDLSYTYGNEKEALKNINLDIYKGEKIAVLGSNGAGKSTFFLNINGVLTPSKGNIIYKGKVITKKDFNELRKSVGIVFQDADNQIIASTVLGEVSFGPMNLKLPKEEVKKRVYEAMEYMNITEFKDRPPHYLSGGEKKRVSIANIITSGFMAIISDEPTASLDPLNISILEEVLEKLSKEDKTIMISTHDMDFAYRWADRIIVFNNGEIVEDGDSLGVLKSVMNKETSNLRVPMLLEIVEELKKNNIIKDKSLYPKTIDELKRILGEL